MTYRRLMWITLGNAVFLLITSLYGFFTIPRMEAFYRVIMLLNASGALVLLTLALQALWKSRKVSRRENGTEPPGAG